MTKLERLIEAILFIEGGVVSLNELENYSGETKQNIEQAINSLIEYYKEANRGIIIIEIAGGYQMVSHPDLKEELSHIFGLKEKTRLSRSALETLSIIAYKQPVTRVEIDKIRGVSSKQMINLLLEKGLIEKAGKRGDLPGKPTVYRTTEKFLKHFGLKSLKDLPPIEEIKSKEFEMGDKGE